MTAKLLLLPGDGIGPEVTAQVRRVIDWLARNRTIAFDLDEDLVGGISLEKTGEPITDEAMARRWQPMRCCSVPSAARNGTRPFDKKPERGLLRLRKDMELFANLRPALCFPALTDALEPEAGARLGSRHHDRPRADRRRLFRRTARHRDAEGRESRRSTPSATRPTRSAASRASPSSWRASARTWSHSAEKANVMHTGVLWREEATSCRRIHRRQAPAHPRRRLRDAAGAQPQAVRRHRDRQSVRRHALRRGRDADRLARHAAVGLARREGRDRQARRSTSRSTAPRPTLPARAWQTRSPRR